MEFAFTVALSVTFPSTSVVAVPLRSPPRVIETRPVACHVVPL